MCDMLKLRMRSSIVSDSQVITGYAPDDFIIVWPVGWTKNKRVGPLTLLIAFCTNSILENLLAKTFLLNCWKFVGSGSTEIIFPLGDLAAPYSVKTPIFATRSTIVASRSILVKPNNS